MHSTADRSIPQPNHPLTIVARAWLHWLDAQKLIPKILRIPTSLGTTVRGGSTDRVPRHEHAVPIRLSTR